MWSEMTNDKLQVTRKLQKGQSLLEVVIVISVGIIVISALVFATISGLRNAQFAKNQAVATKLAQEGLEQLKGIRDRNDSIRFAGLDNQHQNKIEYKFNDLWNYSLSHSVCRTGNKDSPCTFYFAGVNQKNLTRDDINSETLNELFQRSVLIGDENADQSYEKEKIVTVVVKWSDFSGDHESKLSTILRNLNETN